jgi:hypothetical protein
VPGCSAGGLFELEKAQSREHLMIPVATGGLLRPDHVGERGDEHSQLLGHLLACGVADEVGKPLRSVRAPADVEVARAGGERSGRALIEGVPVQRPVDRLVDARNAELRVEQPQRDREPAEVLPPGAGVISRSAVGYGEPGRVAARPPMTT